MEIKPYEKNAKIHKDKQLKLIAESLRIFGWQQPIKVGKDLVIIAGGGHWSRVIIWVKDRLVLSRADYHTQFEPILVENEEENEEGQPILYSWKDGMRRVWNGNRKQTDIWNIKRPQENKEHPTMKPVDLVVRAICNSSVRGAVVLDLFLGGGSTLIASQKSGRVCRGMELDPKYVDVIVQRYVNYTGDANIIKNGESIIWE